MKIAWELTTVAILTIMTYTVLFKHTHIFKFIEHTSIGVGAGYALVLAIRGFLSTTWTPLMGGQITLIIPIILGILILSRASKEFKEFVWLSKWPMAIMIGTTLGVSIRAAIGTMFTQQVQSIFKPMAVMSPMNVFNTILSVIITITVLMFFIFTIERKRGLGVAAQIGRYAIMVAFGALFGSYVLSRTAMVSRTMYQLLFEWLGL